MRKFLFFAFALVAGTLAFNSCDNGNDPEDSIVFNATGELRGVMFPVYNEHQQAVITLHPKANTVDVKFVKARIASESETPQDIYIHNMKLNAGEVHISLVLADGSPYKPFPKSFAYAIMDQKQTTFNMHFGNDDESDTQVYLVFNTMLQPEDPVDPEIDPADFINTQWRTDSCFENGQKSPAPHLYVDIISKDSVLINGEKFSHTYKDGKLNCSRWSEEWFDVLEVKDGRAHLRGFNGTADVYMSQLPKLDMDEMIMMPQAEDFVGTWKLAYYTYDNYNPDVEGWHSVSTNPGVETWEFNADGSCVYCSTFSGETKSGDWSWSDGLRFCNNPAEGVVIAEGEGITVQPLTKNWMSILRSPDGFQYYQWWFCRVK